MSAVASLYNASNVALPQARHRAEAEGEGGGGGEWFSVVVMAFAMNVTASRSYVTFAASRTTSAPCYARVTR